jgi:hypothetical protein
VEESNPYAPPESELERLIDPDKFWRKKKLMVMRKGVDMPGRCIHCNENAAAGKPRCIFYLNIWLQIAMLVLFLVFNFLALIPILIAKHFAIVTVLAPQTSRTSHAQQSL